MQASRRKWAILGGLMVMIAACALFLFRVVSRSEAPAAASQGKASAESPDHELKMLAVELRKKPGHIPVLLRMAQLERERGGVDQAAQHLREALANEPSNLDAHLELGRILYEKGDVGSAIAETEKVLETNPKQVDALYNLGAIYANTGNPARARSYWTRAVQADPAADSSRKAREALTRLGGS
jgi:tetratricopeptide (TPR) repeat protein